ncbi:MAG: RNA polymerase subunit sigma [Caldicoprobacterales bacterium]|nr:RNA polymerase subunit sigma [Clostridiales bacterium]
MRVFPFRAALKDRGRDAVLDDIRAIREGNKALRSQFIEKYSNYILSTASRVKGRYIHIENDEEYPIALSAFNRAIDCYDADKGASFFTFAGLLIKRDIIDLYKKNSAIREISVSQLVEEEDGSRNSGLRIPEDVEKTISFQEERFNLRQEITIYRTLLMEYSIDFDSLVSASPKQAAARRRMIQLAKKLSEDSSASAYIIKRKALPLKEIEGRADFSRKTLERHRKYILANFILINSDLDSPCPLQAWQPKMKRQGKTA